MIGKKSVYLEYVDGFYYAHLLVYDSIEDKPVRDIHLPSDFLLPPNYWDTVTEAILQALHASGFFYWARAINAACYSCNSRHVYTFTLCLGDKANVSKGCISGYRDKLVSLGFKEDKFRWGSGWEPSGKLLCSLVFF